MMGLDTPETCRGWRNILRISCTSSWFFFTRLYRDAGQQNIIFTFISLVFPTKILYEFSCLAYVQQPWENHVIQHFNTPKYLSKNIFWMFSLLRVSHPCTYLTPIWYKCQKICSLRLIGNILFFTFRKPSDRYYYNTDISIFSKLLFYSKYCVYQSLLRASMYIELRSTRPLGEDY